MRLNIRRKNILTLYKFYIILILAMSLVNINEGFGMEEAKNKLINTLVSMDILVENDQKIEIELIRDCLNYSKDFLGEYFKSQKFANVFFRKKISVKNLLGQLENNSIFDNFQQNYNTIVSSVIVQSIPNTRRHNIEVKEKLRNTLNKIINSIFTGPHQPLINNILDQGIYNQEITLDDVDRQVNKRFSPIIMALSFIRESSDNDIFLNSINFNEKKQIRNKKINEKETIVKSLNLTKLNEKMSKVFLNSKRLMFQQISQQLLKTYGIDIFAVENLYVDYISETDLCRYMTFKYNNHIYKVQQQEKSGGVNFGFVLNIYRNANTNELETTKKQSNFELDKNDELIDRFFIKKYYKGTIYTKANNVDSAQSLGTKIPSMTSTSFTTSQTEGSKSVVNKRESERFLDLKEPFIYKILEQLNLGPEVHFIINPYINRGFYIATKDISGNGYFSTMNPMEKKIEVELSGENKFLKNITEENIKNLSIGLSELNLVGLIYSLEDLNTGNYGYIFPNEKASKDYNQNIIDTRDFKIIDFAPPCYRENKKDKIPFDEKYEFKQNIKNILNKYYRIKFDENRFIDLLKEQIVDIDIMKRALSQFEERLQRLDVQSKKDVEDHMENDVGSVTDNENARILEHLLQQQSLSIKTLMQTQRNDIPILKNRTNAELIGFKNGNAPNNIINLEERLQYLNNAFDDLDIYSRGIVQNYKELKRIINKGYNIYFDETGNLKPVELQQQNQQQAQEL